MICQLSQTSKNHIFRALASPGAEIQPNYCFFLCFLDFKGLAGRAGDAVVASDEFVEVAPESVADDAADTAVEPAVSAGE